MDLIDNDQIGGVASMGGDFGLTLINEPQQDNEQIIRYTSQLILDDGLPVTIRPIDINDSDAWIIFVNGLSLQSKYYRFHYVLKDVNAEDARRFCTIDFKNSFALVAEITENNCRKIIAVGRYNRINESINAEFAIVVDDRFQRRGIGTAIMKNLAAVASDNGIRMFEGHTLIKNFEIINFLKKCGFRVNIALEDGIHCVSFSTNNLNCSDDIVPLEPCKTA